MTPLSEFIVHGDDANKILQSHILNVQTSIAQGITDLLRPALADSLKDHLDWFITDLLSLSNMEVEGEEISVGFLYFPNGINDSAKTMLYSAKLGRWLLDEKCRNLQFGIKGFTEFRHLIRELRSQLVGWVPGRFLEPVLILSTDNQKGSPPRVKAVKILRGGEQGWSGASGAYREITRQSGTFAIWLKPAASLRVYKNGELFGQIMRLRDAGGWTTRHVSRLIEVVSVVAETVGSKISESVCRRWIVEPSLSMSECRKGATVVVMPRAKFVELERLWPLFEKDKTGQIKIAASAKHAPVAEEIEEEPTEAEYENYLAQDGALVLSSDGALLGMGTYFKGGPGGRRATAAWVPLVVDNCFTVVTSQDGSIYLQWSEPLGTSGRKVSKGVRLDFVPTKDASVIESELPVTEAEEVERSE